MRMNMAGIRENPYNRWTMSLDFIRESEAFRTLTAALASGRPHLSLTGVAEAAKPYLLTMLAREAGRRLVCIRASSTSLTRFERGCRAFSSALSYDLDVRLLPPLLENPYREIRPSLNAVSSRMAVFHRLHDAPPDLLITTLPGLLKPFPRPDILVDLFLSLSPGDPQPRDALLNRLAEFGYSREDIVNSHGEYAWRGGIVDVFSPWESQPCRIELAGDEVVSLREFDPSSQRGQRRVDRLTLPSLREYRGDAAFFREWEREAGASSPDNHGRDISAKAACLKAGDVYPGFDYQALVVRDHFISFDWYLENCLFLIDDFDRVGEEWTQLQDSLREQHADFDGRGIFAPDPGDIAPPELWDDIAERSLRIGELDPGPERVTISFGFQPVPRFENRIPFFLDYLKRLFEERERCLIFFSNPGVRRKLAALLEEKGIVHEISDDPLLAPRSGEIRLLLGHLDQGFAQPQLKFLCFAERDIFTEERVLVSRPRTKPFLSHFRDLKAGDFVVHTDYGIGVFSGLFKMPVDGRQREFLKLLYRDDDLLFVPMEDLNLVQKYSSLGTAAPILNKLGSPQWEKVKQRTRHAVENVAKELLELYARRKAITGHGFSQSGAWQSDFEKTFDFTETEDQLRVIEEIMRDMESSAPMDRLLCGDVGYGKTEVAMRAAFKAVMDGKQVAVLCPTTVLASQHLKTFRNRLLLFPVRLEGLSRLQSRQQQAATLADLEKGLVDILIGTHRLLSKDVRFHDLGLLVVDEEQRFGVKHKERIKQMRADIDVLTMTATPIPRTLNMSLTGLRDISLIETPPKDRMAIHTVVTTFSRELITSAVRKEMARGGQVFFVHNRVEDIESMAATLSGWLPGVRVVVAHGQMSGVELEKRMIEFVDHRADILISTTIIENGIDIPLVNTLIVNRADRFGLAQLYQLRGRVGRSARQAAAYFLVPSFTGLTPIARERLRALQEFSELGSGFRLAAKDLEIRGAGSFLGARQHGYMEAVGFEYYLHMLEAAVARLKGEERVEVKSTLNLKVDIQIPEEYLPQVNLRLNLYKRVSGADDLAEIDRVAEETGDRYGPPPGAVKNLFHYGRARILARRLKLESLDRVGDKLVFKFFPESSADLSRLTELLRNRTGSMTPQGVMSLRLRGRGDRAVLDETIRVLKELSDI